MNYLTVGKLAKIAGISKVTIRYYEHCGLLPKVMRDKSGYRVYSESIMERVQFIKNAKSVGFTLVEISTLLKLQLNKRTTSQQIKSCAMAKLDAIHEKVEALQYMENTLKKLVNACDGKVPLSKCPIIQGLYGCLQEENGEF